jgi:hypothetical protein
MLVLFHEALFVQLYIVDIETLCQVGVSTLIASRAWIFGGSLHFFTLSRVPDFVFAGNNNRKASLLIKISFLQLLRLQNILVDEISLES